MDVGSDLKKIKIGQFFRGFQSEIMIMKGSNYEIRCLITVHYEKLNHSITPTLSSRQIIIYFSMDNEKNHAIGKWISKLIHEIACGTGFRSTCSQMDNQRDTMMH